MAIVATLDFEEGDTSDFTSTSGTPPTAAAAAALAGTAYGIQCATTGERYGNKTLSSTNILEVRMYLDPNSIAFSAGGYVCVFEAEESVNDCFFLYIEYAATNYAINLYAVLDGGGWWTAVSGTITDAPHYIEMKLKAATGAGANNGIAQLWVDGVSLGSNTSLDNDTQVNAMVNLKIGTQDISGVTGTLYVDEIVIADDNSYIGPRVSMPLKLRIIEKY